MIIRVKVELKELAPESVHRRRDEIGARNLIDLYDDEDISRALRMWAASARSKASKVAGQVGATLADADVEYCIHADASGPIHFLIWTRYAVAKA